MKVENLMSPALGSGNDNNMLIPDSKKKRNTLYHLITLIQNIRQPPRILRYVSGFYPVLQNMIVSTFPHLHVYGDRTKVRYKELLTNIFFFSTMTSTSQTIIITATVILVLLFISFLLMFIIVPLYFRNRTAIFPLLYLFNFFIHVINPILIMPFGFQIGILIEKSYKESSGLAMGLSILSVIFLFFSIILVCLTYVYDAFSICITDSYIFSYTGRFIPVALITPSLILLFSHVFELFHPKLPLITVAISLFYFLFCFVWLFWYPFGMPNANTMMCTVLCGIIVSNIISFTPIHDTELDWIQYAALLGVSILFFFIMKFAFKKRAQCILTSNPKNVSDSLFVLRIALMHFHPVFTGGQLIENISRNAKTDTERINLCRFICYFPEYQPLFVAQLAVLRRAHSLSFSNEFLLFQLRRIDAGFQKHIRSDELTFVTNQTSMISNRLRHLWQQVRTKNSSSLFQTFDWLSHATISCQRKWEELIQMYPYNSKIADEFSRFLIECKGDFTGAAEWQTRAIQIQEGKIFQYSKTTIHFLRAYPNYAKTIIPKSKLTNIDDIDAKTKFQALGTIVSEPEIRSEFQRAMNTTSITSINFFLVNSILSLFFILCFWIALVSISYNEYTQFISNMEIIYDISMMTQQVSMTLLSVLFSLAEIFDVMPSENQLLSIAGHDRINCSNSLVNFSTSFKKSIAIESEKGINYLNSLHNAMLKEINQGKYRQTVLDQFFNNTLSVTYYLSKSQTVSAITNLQSSIIACFSTFTSISWRDDNEWINESDMYNAAFAATQVLDVIDKISNAFLENDQDLYKSESDKLFITMIFIYIIFLVLFFLIPIILFLAIRRSFSRIVSSLRKFPKEVIEEASNIFVVKKSYDSYSVNDSKKSVKNMTVFIVIFTFILNYILLFLLILFHVVSVLIRNDFQDQTSLVQLTSMRACGSTEVLSALLCSHLFYLVVPQIKEKYDLRLQETILSFRELHELCGSISYEGVGSFYKEIMELRTQKKCPDWNENTVHEALGCMATDSLVVWYIDQANSLSSQSHDSNLMTSDSFLLFMHIELSHLFYDLQKIPIMLISSADDKSNDYGNFVLIIGVVSIIVCMFQFFLNSSSYRRFNEINKLLVAFISRINPIDIVNNSELLNLLLHIDQNKSHDLSAPAMIVQNSSLPVIFIDRMSTIEAVNNAFTSCFGYESNFIVCQPISIIIHDDQTLSYIEMMKYMNITDVLIREIQCFKEDGTSSMFATTIIPIADDYTHDDQHQSTVKLKDTTLNKDQNLSVRDKKSIITRFALILKDQDLLKSFITKSKTLKAENDSLISMIYPPIIRASLDGKLKSTAICMIRLQNVGTELLPSRLITQRQELYNQFREILQIYSLLSLLSQKNGIFSVIASGSNDPTELAIECLNFAFTVVEYFMNTASYGNFSAVVETGGEINVNWTGENSSKIVINGPILEKAQKLIEFNQIGKVCISQKTYEYLMHHDMNFREKTIGDETFFIVELNNSTENSTEPIDAPSFNGRKSIPISISQQKITFRPS